MLSECIFHVVFFMQSQFKATFKSMEFGIKQAGLNLTSCSAPHHEPLSYIISLSPNHHNFKMEKITSA